MTDTAQERVEDWTDADLAAGLTEASLMVPDIRYDRDLFDAVREAARRLRARQREGKREPETSQFLRDTLPRNWNYRIHVRGVGGVTVRAWDYEVPETEEYVAEVTQVDPRETRDDRDLLAQIRLGLERIATKRALDTEPPAERETRDDEWPNEPYERQVP